MRSSIPNTSESRPETTIIKTQTKFRMLNPQTRTRANIPEDKVLTEEDVDLTTISIHAAPGNDFNMNLINTFF